MTKSRGGFATGHKSHACKEIVSHYLVGTKYSCVAKIHLEAQAVRKIPEGYVIIEMYNTSRNRKHQPHYESELINGEIIGP